MTTARIDRAWSEVAPMLGVTAQDTASVFDAGRFVVRYGTERKWSVRELLEMLEVLGIAEPEN